MGLGGPAHPKVKAFDEERRHLLGKVARFVYHGILFLLDKFTIPQNEEMFEECGDLNYHSLDMNMMMLMSKK